MSDEAGKRMKVEVEFSDAAKARVNKVLKLMNAMPRMRAGEHAGFSLMLAYSMLANHFGRGDSLIAAIRYFESLAIKEHGVV